MSTTYYVSSTTGALLRRSDGFDDAFYGGAWHPTNTINLYMIGKEDNVDSVTDEVARAAFPDAFARSGRTVRLSSTPQWARTSGPRHAAV